MVCPFGESGKSFSEQVQIQPSEVFSDRKANMYNNYIYIYNERQLAIYTYIYNERQLATISTSSKKL